MKVLDSFKLNGKVALVTGGAGMYGRQITEALGEAGAKVFIASRNIEKLKAVAEDFQGILYSLIVVCQHDDQFRFHNSFPFISDIIQVYFCFFKPV